MKKRFFLLFCLFVGICPLFAQPNPSTFGDNSPAIIAKNFSAVYGVRADAVEAILKIYEKDGLNSARRKSSTESLLKKYQQAPEKKSRAPLLSDATKKDLGLSPALANALDWDLYAGSKYLTTTGINSPAVVAEGDVNIWYGIPPKALRALATKLEEDKITFEEFQKKLDTQVERFKELEKSLVSREDEMAKEAKILLDEGKIDEAVKVLQDRRYAFQKQRERLDKREAESAFDLGNAFSIQLKYKEATQQFQDAVALDPKNSTYLLALGNIENTNAHYDSAIEYYQKALAIDTVAFKDQPERAAVLYGSLGFAWEAKGQYQYAINFYEKALAIDSITFGYKDPHVATDFNHLGSAWKKKGEHDLAITFFEKALAIDSVAFGNKHPRVAIRYISLGETFWRKGEYDHAIALYEKALAIDTVALGNKHPHVATLFNDLGLAWYEKGEFNRAIAFFEKALAIDSIVLGNKHPFIATRYSNLGLAWQAKYEYDLAIVFYEKALAIDSVTFGNKHPEVANDFNNLGWGWEAKGEYDRAIAFYEKALAIDSIVLGNKHPNVALRYSNLGSAWEAKGEYDCAIVYFEKALAIDSVAFGNKHPKVVVGYINIAMAANNQGMNLLVISKKISEALPYLQRSFENAKKARNFDLYLSFLYKIGLLCHLMHLYSDGLTYFEKSIVVSQELDQKSGKPEHTILIREMQYHSAGCLAGLGRKEEANKLYQQLLKEARETNDTRLLEDLKNDGIKD